MIPKDNVSDVISALFDEAVDPRITVVGVGGAGGNVVGALYDSDLNGVETVADWALKGQERAPLRVLELYAGIGNFGLRLARGGALVTLVEGNPAALADARYNARVNHVGRCRFRHGPVETILDASTPDEYDLVFMDPPRTGLSKEALAGLLRLRPYRLVYLSCDPPTLARDLRAMREAGYRVTRLQGFDMFPQTMHIETLAELTQAG